LASRIESPTGGREALARSQAPPADAPRSPSASRLSQRSQRRVVSWESMLPSFLPRPNAMRLSPSLRQPPLAPLLSPPSDRLAHATSTVCPPRPLCRFPSCLSSPPRPPLSHRSLARMAPGRLTFPRLPAYPPIHRALPPPITPSAIPLREAVLQMTFPTVPGSMPGSDQR
jgi:hypothetical protein